MMYSEFESTILLALYQEHVHFGINDIVSFQSMVDKYGIIPKPGWLLEAQKSLLGSGYINGPRNAGSDHMAVGQISGRGMKKIEDQWGSDEGVGLPLSPLSSGPESADNIAELSARLIPASDRFVVLGDNAAMVDEIDKNLDQIEGLVRSSNQLEIGEKNDTSLSLSLARNLINQSSKVLVGAFNYLVVERLRKVFERSIEDALKLSILALLSVIVTSILAVL